MAQKLTLDGITFEQGDGLILFLVDATQSKKCPLRNLNVLPFGAGRHFCPGKSVALIIHNTCVKAVAMSGTLVHARPSKYKQNSLNAFVDYDS
jgi:cytochrome P450